MWIKVFAIFCTSQMIIYFNPCSGINFIDLPGFGSDNENAEGNTDSIVNHKASESSEEAFQEPFNPDNSDIDKKEQKSEQRIESSQTKEQDTSRAYPPVRSTTAANYRRHWLVSAGPNEDKGQTTSKVPEDKDENIKSKITMLVQQTMHDTDLRMKSVQRLKEKYKEDSGYKVGFILSMIKKSRDVLNELFNVAVKHRDEWKALEQLKIFELIVHTNVDTTNLVRQLVEIHIHNINTTVRSALRSNQFMGDEPSKNRVVLM